MPRSKSKRSTYIPPKPARPKPSPRWLPWAGLGLIVAAILIILSAYIFPGVLPGGNLVLIVGFALLAAALILLSNWR